MYFPKQMQSVTATNHLKNYPVNFQHNLTFVPQHNLTIYNGSHSKNSKSLEFTKNSRPRNQSHPFINNLFEQSIPQNPIVHSKLYYADKKPSFNFAYEENGQELHFCPFRINSFDKLQSRTELYKTVSYPSEITYTLNQQEPDYYLHVPKIQNQSSSFQAIPSTQYSKPSIVNIMLNNDREQFHNTDYYTPQFFKHDVLHNRNQSKMLNGRNNKRVHNFFDSRSKFQPPLKMSNSVIDTGLAQYQFSSDASRGQVIITPLMIAEEKLKSSQQTWFCSSISEECQNRVPYVNRLFKYKSKSRYVKNFFELRSPSRLSRLNIGYICKKGLKPDTPNQDDFFILRFADWGLYGVLDGHGKFGHDVSNFVQQHLPSLIYNNTYFKTNPKRALRTAFIKVNELLKTQGAADVSINCSLSGTTATVALHYCDTNKLYVAHVGDSKCILGRIRDSDGQHEALVLTKDHKPNHPQEQKRIQINGGQVCRLDGDIPYRAFIRGQLYPGLAMSRAIGDTIGQKIGIICEPDIYEHTIDTDRDIFFCLSTDGVWEFIPPETVLKIILSFGSDLVQEAADKLAQKSWARWIEEGNIVDDITSAIVFLQPFNIKSQNDL